MILVENEPSPVRTRPNNEQRFLVDALSTGLDLPLSAVRASIEALVQEFSRRESGRSIMLGVLAEVQRIGRNVQDLMDFSRPPDPRPMACSLEEIVVSSARGLTPEHRARMLFSRPRGGIACDGPIVSRCLRRLVENALETDAGSVLVGARQERGHACFYVVDDGRADFDPRGVEHPFRSPKPSRLGLGLPLVRRDAELLNGAFTLDRSPLGITTASIRVPDSEGGCRP